jgi:hypothetical protein
MADESLPIAVLLTAVILALMLLAAYRAFAVRRSLAVGLYRRQALWAGMIASTYVLLFGSNLPFLYLLPPNNWLDLIASFLQDVGIFFVFAWVDASTLIARRSDPLLRDPVHWTKVRKRLWALMALSLVSSYVFAISLVLQGGSLSSGPSPPELAFLLVIIVVPFGSGAVTIPISASRSGDSVFRKHLKWLSVTMVSFVAITLYFGALLAVGTAYGYLDLLRAVLSQTTSTIFVFILGLILSYSLYRSAQSLAPLNRTSAQS